MEGNTEKPIRSDAVTSADEAAKKNTDCIYFLASPLTCKKGSECEYRHSEGARVNPRDCWYWFNGSCLNAKCPFRHPPLDGLLGHPVPVSRSLEPPSKLIATSPVPLVHGSIAHNNNKQNVPCYYFQKGHCSKGERCSFVHKPQPANSYVLQHKNEISSIQSEPSTKMVTNQSNMPLPKVAAKQNVSKSKEILPLPGDHAIGHQTIHNKNSSAGQVSSADASHGLLFGSKKIPLNTPSQPQTHLSQLRHVNHENVKKSDNFHKESSSGPGNLVEHRIEGSSYFQNEDKYFKVTAHGGMGSTTVSYHGKRQLDHETLQQLESDHYQEMRTHDRYEPAHGHYDRERLRSSMRTLDRPMPETRMLEREEKYEKIDNLDLRHRLSKHKRSNGFRSAVNFEVEGVHTQSNNDFMNNERYQTQHSYQDRQHFPKDGSISSRLHGRIVLPSKLPPDQHLRSQVDREGTGHRRKSPRPISSQVKHHERIKNSLSEDPRAINSSGRLSLERDERESLDFAPPKSLAELKLAKVSDSSASEGHRSLKSGRVLGHCKLESSLSFEGPKPLSLLKRKRDSSPIKCSSFANSDDNIQGDLKDDSSILAAALTLNGQSKQSSVYQNDQGTINSPFSEEEEGQFTEEGENLFNDGQLSAKGDAAGSEEGMIMDDLDDQELENYGDRSHEYDGGEAEDAKYKLEEDENEYQDDEDDDDEDDFAKKVGLMMSRGSTQRA